MVAPTHPSAGFPVFEILEPRLLLADVSGHITADTVWNDTAEPYRVVGDLYVDYGATLTLGSGVTLRTDNAQCNILVDGRLEGTSATIELTYGDDANRAKLLVPGGGQVSLSGGRVLGSAYVEVQSGGRADLADMLLGDFPVGNVSNVVYLSGSSGSIDDCNIETLDIASPTVTVTGGWPGRGYIHQLDLSASATVTGDNVAHPLVILWIHFNGGSPIVSGCNNASMTFNAGTPTVTGNYMTSLFLNGGKPTVTRNHFTPCRIHLGDWNFDTSGISGNTYSTTTHIEVPGGTLQSSRLLGPFDGQNPTYWFYNTSLTVPAGVVLSVARGISVSLEGSDLFVDGVLQSPEANIWLSEGRWDRKSVLEVRRGGRVDLDGGTVRDSGRILVREGGGAELSSVTFGECASLSYERGSVGSLEYSTLKEFTVDSGANVWIANNKMSGASVSVTGSSLTWVPMENNWWGSTDAAVVETKINDHSDDPNLPTVIYQPWLLRSPIGYDGFYVTGRNPQYIGQSTDHLDVTFNKHIDLSTLTTANVSLVGPAGVVPISSISNLERTSYRIWFPKQTVPGTYSLKISQNVKDLDGNKMDQDLDGTFGQVNDAYASNVICDLTPPWVVSQTPGGDISGTVSSVDVTFSDIIYPPSFPVDNVQIFSPTGAAIAPTSVTRLTDSRYRISFAPQTAAGQYHLAITPNVLDKALNPLDQDRNGTGGQPTDTYAGTFNLVDVDLSVSDLVANASELWANDTVHVSWMGANKTGYELLGDWTDAVYLSADDTWDMSDVLLATVPHTGGLAAGAPYSQAVDVTIPGVLPGDYRIIVRADMYGQEKEAGRKGNNVVASAALPLHVHALNNDGTPVSGTLSPSNRSDYYAVELPPRQNVKLTLDSAATTGANEIYVKRGGIPTRQDYDYRIIPGGPDAELTVPATYDGGTYYVLVYADQVSGTQAYQLKGQASGIFLSSVTPDHYGKQTPGTLSLTGDGFDDTTVVELIASDNSVLAPTRTNIISSTQATADFDLPAIPAGVYDVRVRKAGGAFDEKADVFTVVAGVGPRLATNLITPANVRVRGAQTCWIEYSNTGDAPMSAPLLRVSTDGAAYITLDSTLRDNPAWPPPDVTDTITVWATGSGATPGMLQPGESGRIAFYYLGMKSGASTVPYTLASVGADSTEPVDWASIKNDARPEWIPTDAWDAQWAAFTAQMGSTWGDFVRERAEILNYLQGVGEDAANISMDEILAFAIVQSSQAGPGPILASAVDAYSTAPGISLVFGRMFSQSPQSRFLVGSLGHGWSSNWDYSVQVLSTGDVVVRGPGGYNRLFEKGTTSGTFVPLPGDYGTLTSSGGLYRLREKGGTVYQFRSDLLLDYVEDTNGNRVTCGYTSGLLTSLTHSNGDQILIDYNASGRIWHVTDPLGPGTADDRVTTFTYDASGTYLLSVTAPGSRVTTYTYQTTGGAPVLHSLLSVAYADGKHTYFGYDAYGRVSETSADGGAGRVTYSYPSLGTVVAVDVAGVTTTVHSGSSCQPVRIEVPGSVVRTQYDSNGDLTQLTGPEGQLSRFSYDANGNLTGLVDPTRGSTQFAYDPTFNQLASLTDARGSGTDYAYDARGNLTRITYEDGTHEDFTYDSVGNVLTWTNRRGQTVTYTYDAAGEITSKDYPDTAGITDYVYTYDAAGNLTSATDAAGTTTFAYQPNTDWL
ncbi:MAG: hypothetical protein NTU53_01175 [Planctomycetota bacterium]|nr:hypothetical protein [Planctomycetota bacterium]